MKVLYIGGQKSGKSRLAEAKTLEICGSKKPFYVATSEAMDAEMIDRIERHKAQRADRFETIESPTKLYETLCDIDGAALVECLSIWINNMLYYGKNDDDIYDELTRILSLEKSAVFVLNDVGSGIIPENKLARRFIDISGKAGQIVAAACDEVYFCAVGLSVRMK